MWMKTTTTTNSATSSAHAANQPKESVSASQIDDILANITRSSARLESSLAKMPPLPKYKPSSSIYNRSKFLRSFLSKTPKTSSRTSYGETEKCICCKYNKYVPSFSPTSPIYKPTFTPQSKYNTEHEHHCHNFKFNAQCSSMLQSREHKHENLLEDMSKATSSPYCTKCTPTQRVANTESAKKCCHKTNQLPCMQQHLVLNQTIDVHNSKTNKNCSDCQNSCQAHLTLCSETKSETKSEDISSKKKETTTTKSAKSHGHHLQCYPALKPQSYFEELLLRDRNVKSCHSKCQTVCKASKCQKPRAPVKVDINVRLVPKTVKTNSEQPEIELTVGKEQQEKNVQSKDNEQNMHKEIQIEEEQQQIEQANVLLEDLEEQEQKTHF